jgi:hypothetical protein
MSKSSSGFASNPMFEALGEEQRKAMTAAFEAMAKWRQELNSMSEKNSAAVFDKMSEAAKAVGWPSEFVDMTRQQMQSVTKMQSQAIEQVMNVWEKQATQPAAKIEMPTFPGMPSFGSMPSFPTFPGMPSPGSSMPGMPDMSSMPMVPLQFWMQAAEMWQKSWQQALTTWMDAQKTMLNSTGTPPKSGSGR